MSKAEKRRTQLKELIAERIALRVERDRYREALEQIVARYGNSTAGDRIVLHPADIAKIALAKYPTQSTLSGSEVE